ncbi:helix-turn-helix domain-containing protein [Rhodococcus phenolicus]|uniref:helix-turn-helix domain-containing protein n=1 Tax=Rhodococcus phenolicus TaxID=263849 RepID=UPI000833FF5B|nr:helix-turn-helix transcriptional regulator [Rhodococcus phenolicus]
MTSSVQRESAGALLRHWRERRGLSQLALANLAGVSARHVSFVETGRSKPSRRMLLELSDHLDLPLRERNALLLAAGLAPAYPEHRLGDVPMAAVSDAIGRILTSHMPFPALVVDRHWTMIDANDAVVALVADCAPSLIEPPVNVLRLTLHPDGLAPRIANLGQWRAHLLARLRHQIAASGDPELMRLHAELEGYPGGDGADHGDGAALVVPLRLRSDDGELSLLSTTTLFGTPLDVTVSELAIEAFYPADDATARVLLGR